MTIETKQFNDRAVFWRAVQWKIAGPFVFCREIVATGEDRPWILAAVTFDPVRYVRAAAGSEGYDVGIPR